MPTSSATPASKSDPKIRSSGHQQQGKKTLTSHSITNINRTVIAHVQSSGQRPVLNARRRVQCAAQLPASSVYQPAKQPKSQKSMEQLVTPLKKFDGTPVKDASANEAVDEKKLSKAARKSSSMSNLTPVTKMNLGYGLSPGKSLSRDRLDFLQSAHNIGRPSSKKLVFGTLRELRAAGVVGRSLVINAWRKRRDEVANLKAGMSKLSVLNLQVYTLKECLQKEHERIIAIEGALQRSKARAAELAKERDQLKTEKESSEAEIAKLKEHAEERAVNAENLRNELGSARDQFEALDKQIAKDREKLLKLREENETLLTKLSTTEKLLAGVNKKVVHNESTLEETQIQLATQMAINSSLQEEIQRYEGKLRREEEAKSQLEQTLEELEDKYARMEERLQVSEERVHESNIEILSQDATIKQWDAACRAQLLQLNELKEQLYDRQLKGSKSSGWSSSVKLLAGSVISYPQFIFRTLSFFLTGLPLNLD